VNSSTAVVTLSEHCSSKGIGEKSIDSDKACNQLFQQTKSTDSSLV
jgi:hypothetical protein